MAFLLQTAFRPERLHIVIKGGRCVTTSPTQKQVIGVLGANWHGAQFRCWNCLLRLTRQSTSKCTAGVEAGRETLSVPKCRF